MSFLCLWFCWGFPIIIVNHNLGSVIMAINVNQNQAQTYSNNNKPTQAAVSNTSTSFGSGVGNQSAVLNQILLLINQLIQQMNSGNSNQKPASNTATAQPATGNTAAVTQPVTDNAVETAQPTAGNTATAAPVTGDTAVVTQPATDNAVETTQPTAGSTATTTQPVTGNTAAVTPPATGNAVETVQPTAGNTVTATQPVTGNTAAVTPPVTAEQPVVQQPAIYNDQGNFNGAFAAYAGNQTHKASELQKIVEGFSKDAAAGKGTGTGLDSIVSNILEDSGLRKNISSSDIRGGAYSANALNHLFSTVAEEIGAAKDGKFTEEEIETIGSIVSQNYGEAFLALHGNDEGKSETGFHLVQNDGGTNTLNLDGTNRAAVNTVFDGFYHYGFDVEKGAFLNEDGNANQTVKNVTNWVNEIYFQAPDQSQGHAAASSNFGVGTDFNGAFSTYNNAQTHSASELTASIAGFSQDAANGKATGTGLDKIVTTILEDDGLDNKISGSDQRGGAYSANALNHLFNQVATETGATADGKFTQEEVETIGAIVGNNYEDLFLELHGNDEGKEETGFHLVQNDGATSKVNLDGANRAAVDTVFDGLYHYGFDVEKGRFLNEDGNANQKVSDVTNWLNALYYDKDDGVEAKA